MTTFKSDNPDVLKTLKDLEILFLKNGGWLHRDLIIREKGGEFSLETPPEFDRAEALVVLPTEGLISLKIFKMGLAGNEILLSGGGSQPDPLKREIFETTLGLFNLTCKIKYHRKANPWVTIFRKKNLFEAFRKGRPNLDFVPEFEALLQKGDEDSIVLESFFHTRPIDLFGEKQLFMPVLDFANHHFRGQIFKVEGAAEKDRSLKIFNSKPVPGSNEVFVKYQNFDAFDLFMIYGFADASAPFVRSIPLTLTLEGLGEIEILDYLGIEVTKPLPADLENLRFYLPKIIEHREGFMKLSHLLIPGPPAPNALRRVLASLLPVMAPKAEKKSLQKWLKGAENQVVKKNIDFYKNLQETLQKETSRGCREPALETAQAMVKIQLTKLGNYQIL